MRATNANTSEAEARIVAMLTERPTLAVSRLCHNAQADLVRKQQVLGSNPSVGSSPSPGTRQRSRRGPRVEHFRGRDSPGVATDDEDAPVDEQRRRGQVAIVVQGQTSEPRAARRDVPCG